MLQVKNLSKSYGSRFLFEDITFSLAPGERLGLIGRNGSGKSTIFRLILGVESPDQGTISVPRGYRVGHLAQHLEFDQETILQEVCLGLPEDERDQEYKGEIILAGLGFSESDMQRAPSEFSGGFQIRLNLAKLLLSEPNLLLLDEPTNYLDIVSMRWLETFLREWKNEVILITHDRTFMDSITTDTMLIHRAKIRKISGQTGKLYSRVQQDEEIYEKTRLNEDKRRKDLELFINRFRAQASKATLVQSKVKELERMGQKEELQDEAVLDFQFCEAPFAGKLVSEVSDLEFGYPGAASIIKKLSFVIKKQDRIGIIGKNGKGKSTLLRLLAQELEPIAGKINLNPNARLGYFGQTNIARLSPNLTVEEEINQANQLLQRTKIRAICGSVMFSGDNALKKISVLSGGEKSRVLLGKILAQPTNFLLLDEPTNHLDMESIEALIKSIKEYQGALVIVTHNELLLREVVNRLIVFEGPAPELLEHTYDYFLETRGWSDENEAKPSGSSNTRATLEKRELSAHEIERAERKLTEKLQRKVSQTEQKITELEAELKQLEEALGLASEQLDLENLEQLTYRFSDKQAEIEACFVTLEELEKQLKADPKGQT